jgi:hypothetical protein
MEIWRMRNKFPSCFQLVKISFEKEISFKMEARSFVPGFETTSGFKYSLLIAEFKHPHPRDENKDQIPEGGETKIDQIPHICPPPPPSGV